MSIIPLGLSIPILGALNLINPVLFRQRNIGGFIADVTVSEQHVDELAITDHPVEQGAAVTDHAFKRPSVVVIEAGFSDASYAALGDPNYVNDIYDAFLTLQASRQPFDVVTGKRAYSNMLFQRISTRTDEKTENALFLTCECREIILVNTQTVALPNADAQKNPEVTAPTQNGGAMQLQSGSNFIGTP